MKMRIFKILKTGSGDEFFVTSTKKPKLKKISKIIAQAFCMKETEVIKLLNKDYNDILMYEVQPINLIS